MRDLYTNLEMALAAGFFVVIAACNAQVVSSRNAGTPAVIQDYPYLDLSTASKAHSSEQIESAEQERANRYDRRLNPPLFDKSAPEKSGTVHWSRSVTHSEVYDPLPTAASDIVVVGTVTTAIPHLSKSGTDVYSVFTVVPSLILKGVSVTDATQILAERDGGVVLYPSGKKEFIGDTTLGLPVPGFRYLLFLKRVSQGSFLILRGYALTTPAVKSLDSIPNSVNQLGEQALLQAVRAKL